MPTEKEITTVSSLTIAGSNTRVIPLMPPAYAKNVRRINDELEEQVNVAKPRKSTSMERLQASRAMAHDKGNWKEVKQVEKSISRKQSVHSAARKRESKGKKI